MVYQVHLLHHRLEYSGGTQVELWTPDRTTCINNYRANNSSSTSRPLPHKRPRPPLCPRYVTTTIDPLYTIYALFLIIACFSILYSSLHVFVYFFTLHILFVGYFISICAGLYSKGIWKKNVRFFLIFPINEFRICFLTDRSKTSTSNLLIMLQVFRKVMSLMHLILELFISFFFS